MFSFDTSLVSLKLHAHILCRRLYTRPKEESSQLEAYDLTFARKGTIHTHTYICKHICVNLLK